MEFKRKDPLDLLVELKAYSEKKPSNVRMIKVCQGYQKQRRICHEFYFCLPITQLEPT